MREALQEGLERLRDEYSDDIPQEIVHSNSLNNKFKVRGSWFQGVIAILENGITEGGITDPVVIQRVERGINRFTTRKFGEEDPTKPRDIKYANLLIKLVLEGK